MKTRIERNSSMIDGIGRMTPLTPALPEAGARGKEDTARPRSERAGQTAATLSLPQLSAEMAASPPVDTARVASLREAIRIGSYRVDPAAIAQAIMAQGGL
jgi:negative regulator of flagellin synthesis FlgM